MVRDPKYIGMKYVESFAFSFAGAVDCLLHISIAWHLYYYVNFWPMNMFLLPFIFVSGLILLMHLITIAGAAFLSKKQIIAWEEKDGLKTIVNPFSFVTGKIAKTVTQEVLDKVDNVVVMG